MPYLFQRDWINRLQPPCALCPNMPLITRSMRSDDPITRRANWDQSKRRPARPAVHNLVETFLCVCMCVCIAGGIITLAGGGPGMNLIYYTVPICHDRADCCGNRIRAQTARMRHASRPTQQRSLQPASIRIAPLPSLRRRHSHHIALC